MEILDLSIKLNIDVPSSDLISLAESAYDLANDAQSRYLGLDDPEIHIWVEQGSTKYRTKIYAGLIVFYNVISNIDGFVGGLEKIYDYGSKTMNYITERVIEPAPFRVMEVKRSVGLPEKIKKILRDVQQGKLSPDNATSKVMKLLEAEEADEQLKLKFLNSFMATAEVTYRSPGNQLNVFPEEEILISTKSLPPKSSHPKAPPVEASLQGVELWYNRRTGNKEVKMYTK
jgi:hypothetical protein